MPERQKRGSPPKPAAAHPATASITLPSLISVSPEAFLPTKIEVRISDRDTRLFTKSLAMSIEAAGATLRSGEKVKGGSAAIQWVLEQIQDSLQSELPKSE